MPTRGPLRTFLFEATVTDIAHLTVMADNMTCIGILFSDGTHQLLVYVDDVNLTRDNIDTTKKNRENFV
jgi:hypothetical protein